MHNNSNWCVAIGLIGATIDLEAIKFILMLPDLLKHLE